MMGNPPTSNTSTLPLRGLCVLSTRAEHVGTGSMPTPAADPLVERLSALGAEVVLQPAIRIGPPADWRPVDDAIRRLGEFDWLVFSSANGVRFFFDRLAARKGDRPIFVERQKEQSPAASFVIPKLAAIGPGTAEELARRGLRAEVVPEPFRAEALADALAPGAPGKRFLLIRASRGRDVLRDRLTAAGAKVEQIVAYASDDVETADEAVATRLRAGRIDWITATSSAIARSLARLFGDDLRLAKLASISPLTSGTLRELGFEPAAEAKVYTLAGLADAIVEHTSLSLGKRVL